MPPTPRDKNDLLPPAIIRSLQRSPLLGAEPWQATPLTGGVSSDIFLVHPHGRPPFVIKRALPQLRVQAEWRVDPARNAVEHRWLRTASQIVPGHVPAVLHTDDEAGYFAMEYLASLAPWKSSLLKADGSVRAAADVGRVLGQIHATTWDNRETRNAFSNDSLFHALRLEPYLLHTGAKHPALQDQFRAMAESLANSPHALIHGDYSPKNLLVGPNRFVVLDAEVGCFGDPIFDAAFLLSHLYLKSLYHHPSSGTRACLDLAESFRDAYAAALGPRWSAPYETRGVELLLMLLLARVDGKSPVEYLPPSKQQFIRKFVAQYLPTPPSSLAELSARWTEELRSATS